MTGSKSKPQQSSTEANCAEVAKHEGFAPNQMEKTEAKCVAKSAENKVYAQEIGASAKFGREQDAMFPLHHGNRQLA
jgi:hypothetical protein